MLQTSNPQLSAISRLMKPAGPQISPVIQNAKLSELNLILSNPTTQNRLLNELSSDDFKELTKLIPQDHVNLQIWEKPADFMIQLMLRHINQPLTEAEMGKVLKTVRKLNPLSVDRDVSYRSEIKQAYESLISSKPHKAQVSFLFSHDVQEYISSETAKKILFKRPKIRYRRIPKHQI
jgi:hypothetical protein